MTKITLGFLLLGAIFVIVILKIFEARPAVSPPRQSNETTKATTVIAVDDMQPGSWDLLKMTASVFQISVTTCLIEEFLGTFDDGVTDCRKVLRDQAGVLCLYYINQTCRPSLCGLGAVIDALPAKGASLDVLQSVDISEQWQFCGIPWQEVADVPWDQCVGDWRGEFCGWWNMIHTTQLTMWRVAQYDELLLSNVSAQLLPAPPYVPVSTFNSTAINATRVSADFAAEALRLFIEVFLPCTTCVIHFQKVNTQLLTEVTDEASLVMWFWRYHNGVSLFTLEETLVSDFLYDANYPHRPWPATNLCPDCHANYDLPNPTPWISQIAGPDFQAFEDVQWDEAEVFLALQRFYLFGGF